MPDVGVFGGWFFRTAAGAEGVLQVELFGHLRAPGVASERLSARHAPPDRRQLRFRLRLIDVVAPPPC
jgi:hypothetical protein